MRNSTADPSRRAIWMGSIHVRLQPGNALDEPNGFESAGNAPTEADPGDTPVAAYCLLTPMNLRLESNWQLK